ncbi:hypothetical protein AAJ76_3000043661 [Vairimorpha ceranae]|uniref:Uncharacterized protein n=1 Tax=Vairimorpha ceranae TaxID=40302 RepID=A0A0F9WEE4_9MICR|nr:hypothetical protein AAJ76_3000043661 [Vairimorpha ceranae]KKO75165.1 hypothetical protein AAJ76_3000043661 [Vairimorpha ceranae]
MFRFKLFIYIDDDDSYCFSVLNGIINTICSFSQSALCLWACMYCSKV